VSDWLKRQPEWLEDLLEDYTLVTHYIEGWSTRLPSPVDVADSIAKCQGAVKQDPWMAWDSPRRRGWD